MRSNQLNLFEWADSRPSAEVIDLTPIIVRNMPAVDPRYPEPAQVIYPAFERKRNVA
jgi:hypothetical protein